VREGLTQSCLSCLSSALHAWLIKCGSKKGVCSVSRPVSACEHLSIRGRDNTQSVQLRALAELSISLFASSGDMHMYVVNTTL
jgi:hypothetical protein